jgi:hypothetical protein
MTALAYNWQSQEMAASGIPSLITRLPFSEIMGYIDKPLTVTFNEWETTMFMFGAVV